MAFSRKQVDCCKLDNVRKQAYLGVILSEDGKMECELEMRIGAALSAAGAVRSQVVETRELSRSAKMLVYKAMIEPTLTYGTESWVLKEREKQRIQTSNFSYRQGLRRRNEGITATNLPPHSRNPQDPKRSSLQSQVIIRKEDKPPT